MKVAGNNVTANTTIVPCGSHYGIARLVFLATLSKSPFSTLHIHKNYKIMKKL